MLPAQPKEENNQFKNKNQPELPNKLYGSLTKKELKKKHSSRLVGGWRWAAVVEKMCDKVAAGGPGGQGSGRRTGQSHICVQINREELLGSDTYHATQCSSAGKIKPWNL